MMQQYRSNRILIADDNPDDCLLIEEAFKESGHSFDLAFVHDGIELEQYLQRDNYSDLTSTQRPDLILLDLNMPRKSGFDVLTEIKADPNLRSIPVVVLTISSADEDILRTYELGGSGFIIKPNLISEMVEVVEALNQYWFEVVELSGVDYRNRKHYNN